MVEIVVFPWFFMVEIVVFPWFFMVEIVVFPCVFFPYLWDFLMKPRGRQILRADVAAVWGAQCRKAEMIREEAGICKCSMASQMYHFNKCCNYCTRLYELYVHMNCKFCT